jgi:SAM-dependent methyltransferase
MITTIAISIWLSSASCLGIAADQAADGAQPSGVALLRAEASALEPLVASQPGRDFLKAAILLPAVAPRTIYADKAKQNYFTEAEFQALDQSRRQALVPIPVDETFYYTTKYGSPLAYARPIDLLGAAGLESVAGKRILDFGYGTIGHLHLLATLGADVTGVDVDPLLRALYGTKGETDVARNPQGIEGRVRLIHGRFPSNQAVVQAVGAGYDLIISKNTLKKGYVHPERPVDKRRLLNLDVDDRVFLEAIHTALKRGGRILIYNICPAPGLPGEPYKNWADGRCPFPAEAWDSAGFRKIAFDRDDSGSIRRVAHALGWDRGESPMDLQNDLFAMYSLFEKK